MHKIKVGQSFRGDSGDRYRIVRFVDSLLKVNGTWYNESRVVYEDCRGQRFERFVSDFLLNFEPA